MLSSTLDAPSLHDAVDGHRFAGAHDERVAGHDVIERHVDDHAVAPTCAVFGCKPQQPFQRAPMCRAFARASSSLPSSTSVMTAAAASK